MLPLKISQVQSSADLKEFVDLPFRLYRDDPQWAPYIKRSFQRLLDPKRHPFWKFAFRELFLARRGANVIGRIAALVDRNHNQRHGEKSAAWGFFESDPDAEAVMGLFAEAEKWARAQGMEMMRGPLNPSLNYEAGLLTKGFEYSSVLMLPYNPPYYGQLVRQCNYEKEKDLLTFRIDKDYRFPEWALKLAERVIDRREITVEKAETANIEPQLVRMSRLYQECWGNNWGFVPFTPEELSNMASEIVPIIDPDMAFLLRHNQQDVCVLLAVPNINPFLKRLDGKLGLSALIKKKLYWKELTGVRVLLFGVKPEYQVMGVPMAALHQLRTALYSKPQYQFVEAGWTLEDNRAINAIFEEGGIQPNKVHRIYRKKL